MAEQRERDRINAAGAKELKHLKRVEMRKLLRNRRFWGYAGMLFIEGTSALLVTYREAREEGEPRVKAIKTAVEISRNELLPPLVKDFLQKCTTIFDDDESGGSGLTVAGRHGPVESTPW